MKLLSGIALSLLLQLQVHALEAKFQADSLRGSLGDIISFSWIVTHRAQDTLFFSELNLEQSGIELLSQNIYPLKEGSELRMEAAVYDSVGIYHFPDLVAYSRSGAVLDSIFLRGPDLQILSVLSPADSSFRDIKDLHRISMPLPWKILMFVALALIIIMVLIFAIRRLRFNRKTRESLPQVIPPEEAHFIALREFESLRRSKLLNLEQYKEFHSRLTHILKQYFENRFLMDALELTSEECLDKLTQINVLSATDIQHVQGILELADMIKFAKKSSNELESGQSLATAVQLVENTKLNNDQGENT